MLICLIYSEHWLLINMVVFTSFTVNYRSHEIHRPSALLFFGRKIYMFIYMFTDPHFYHHDSELSEDFISVILFLIQFLFS